MHIDDIAAPSADSFKFAEIGDTIRGTIVHVPDKPYQRVNQFNGREEEVIRIVISTDDGERAIYPVRGSFMAQAIAQAVRDSGNTQLEAGGTLAVQYAEDRGTGKPNPAKVFKAQYKAPVTGTTVDDLI